MRPDSRDVECIAVAYEIGSDDLSRVLIRPARLADKRDILVLEAQAWPEGLRASEGMLKSRLEAFPDGQIVATVNGAVRGFLSTQIIEYQAHGAAPTWNQATDNGFIRKTHNSKGNTLFGVNLSVWPGTQPDVAQQLMFAGARLIVVYGLEGAILGARIPRYSTIANEVPVEEYVRRTTRTGRHVDPELHFYSSFGFTIVGVVPHYINDPQSLDYGVLIYWRNPLYSDVSDTSSLSSIDQLCDYESGGMVSRWTLLLPGAGCHWARQSGCYMCGFSKAINEVWQGRQPTALEMRGIYRIGRDLAQHQRPDIMAVYNGGSFLNENEVPASVQLEIIKDVAEHQTLRRVMVETRPEFVTSERLYPLMEQLQGKRLQLAIGLEVASDFVRKNCVNKGFSRRHFEAAVRTAKDMGASVLTYAFLKPLYLTEKEAIIHANETVQYAFSVGSDAVSLEAAFVQEGTLMHDHYLQGRFRPPWLWSIIEVVSSSSSLGPLFVGRFKDHPPPIAVPHNCGICDAPILDAFEKYNLTLDARTLNTPSCTCKDDWNRELAAKHPSLRGRIAQ